MRHGSASATAVLATYGTLITIALVMILARFYLRITVHRNWRLLTSDLLIAAAWCAAVATASFDIVFYKRGVLKPEVDYTLKNFDTTLENFEYVAKMVWASVIPFYATLYLSKLSLIAVYFQLFPIFMVKLRVALWVTLGYCISAWVVSLSLHFFLCWPVERIWQVSRPERLCDFTVPQTVFQVGWALNFAGSIAIFILPFFIIHNIRMRRSTMFAIYGTLSLGAVDIAFSLTRFLIVQLTQVGDSRSITTIELWCALDMMVGLIVACLPSLRPYLRRDFRVSSVTNSRRIPSNPPGSSKGIFVNREITTSNNSEQWRDRELFEQVGSDDTSESGEIGPSSHITVIGNDVRVKGGREERSGERILNDRRSTHSWQDDKRGSNREIELV